MSLQVFYEQASLNKLQPSPRTRYVNPSSPAGHNINHRSHSESSNIDAKKCLTISMGKLDPDWNPWSHLKFIPRERRSSPATMSDQIYPNFCRISCG
ncbi:hypothetical protein AAMO2058_001749200 [Amorphochlora amoebiformis]